MVTPEYTLILTPSGSKMALPPRKPPQHKNKSLFPPTVIFQKLKYICILYSIFNYYQSSLYLFDLLSREVFSFLKASEYE